MMPRRTLRASSLGHGAGTCPLLPSRPVCSTGPYPRFTRSLASLAFEAVPPTEAFQRLGRNAVSFALARSQDESLATFDARQCGGECTPVVILSGPSGLRLARIGTRVAPGKPRCLGLSDGTQVTPTVPRSDRGAWADHPSGNPSRSLLDPFPTPSARWSAIAILASSSSNV